VAVGTTTITVTTQEGSHTAACTVTVAAAGAQDITIGFKDDGSGAFSQGTFTLKQGGTPNSQTITLLGTWDSQEWRVDGFVKDTGANFTVNATDYTVGGHSLQVTALRGSVRWSKTLQFTVSAAVTGVSLNTSALNLLVNETGTLFPTVSPGNAENRALSWTSGNPAVATVNNGVVTGVSLGTAVITVTTQEGGYTAACTVTVGAAQGISLGFKDDGSGAFSQAAFTLSQGTPDSQTITLLGTWDSQEWQVDGFVKGNGTNFTVNAADYTLGGHSLRVTVLRGAVRWSKTLQFTVTN
jgi:uncharacterized protein YjdB